MTTAITFGENRDVISGTWSEIKAVIQSKNLFLQYVESDGTYTIFAFDASLVYTCSIWTGTVPDSVDINGYSQAQNDSDKSDFETNFQASSNKRISSPTSADGTLQISKQRLELGRESFKRIDNASEQMNINGIAAGIPVNIWNGTGAGDSGSDWTRTGVGSESDASAHSGTNGLDSGITAQNDMIVFDFGSMTNITGQADQVEFWIQLKAVVVGGQIHIGWTDDVDTMVGNTVKISNYLSNLDLDVWKKVTIPIGDFNMGSNAQKLFFRFEQASGIQIWLDDIAIVPSAGGGPYIFRISAPTGYIYHVERIALVVSAPDTGWSSTAFANIVGGLTNGLAFRYRILGGDIYWSFNCKNNTELFGQLATLNDINFDDSEQMIVFALEPQLSSVVLTDDNEVVEIIVRDDLSSLTDVRAFLHYGVEEIPT